MASAWHVLPFLLLAPALAMPFDCDGATTNGHNFVASSLEGNWQVHYREDRGASIHNTTYTINLCKPLQHDDDKSQDQQCHIGARVCAQKYVYNKESEVLTLDEVTDIAGQYTDTNRHMDSKIEWLGTHDQEQEGYRVTLNGGRSPYDGSKGKKQRAVIDFICDDTLTGLEGLKESKAMKRRDDDEDEKPSLPDLDEGKSLQYTSFLIGEEVDTLRLSWKTKLACANATSVEPDPPKRSGGWGFFTWFVIM